MKEQERGAGKSLAVVLFCMFAFFMGNFAPDPAEGASVKPGSVTVTPGPAFIQAGGTQTFSAAVTDQQGEPMVAVAVAWSLSNRNAGSISRTGTFTAGSNAATTEVIARVGSRKDAVVGKAQVTVLGPAAVVVDPVDATVNAGETKNFTATVTDQQKYEMPGVAVTWSVSNRKAGSISTAGVFTPGNDDAATDVIASVGRGRTAMSDKAKVTVIGAPKPATITISQPDNSILEVGETRTLVAAVKDQRGQDMPGEAVEWTVSNRRALEFVSKTGSSLEVKALSVDRETNVQVIAKVASNRRVTNGVTLTVLAAPKPATVSITHGNAALKAGETDTFTATVKDQQGNVMKAEGVEWSLTNGSAVKILSKDSSSIAIEALTVETSTKVKLTANLASNRRLKADAEVTVLMVQPVSYTGTFSGESTGYLAFSIKGSSTTGLVIMDDYYYGMSKITGSFVEEESAFKATATLKTSEGDFTVTFETEVLNWEGLETISGTWSGRYPGDEPGDELVGEWEINLDDIPGAGPKLGSWTARITAYNDNTGNPYKVYINSKEVGLIVFGSDGYMIGGGYITDPYEGPSTLQIVEGFWDTVTYEIEDISGDYFYGVGRIDPENGSVSCDLYDYEDENATKCGSLAVSPM